MPLSPHDGGTTAVAGARGWLRGEGPRLGEQDRYDTLERAAAELVQMAGSSMVLERG
jgi:hypothetical protein